MKAISIQHPFADDIVRGLKTKEYRTWPIAFRGRLLIHASKTMRRLTPEQRAEVRAGASGLAFGAVVGFAVVVDCVPHIAEDGAQDGYAWILEEPRRLSTPVVFPGALGLFDVPAELFRGARWTRRKKA